MHLPRRAVIVYCAVLVIGAFALPAFARFVPNVDWSPSGTSACVKVNDRAAILFRTPNAGLTPGDRAALTVQRIDPIAQSGQWRAIHVKLMGKKRAQILAGDAPICVATAADAKCAKTSAAALAGMWAANLRKLLAMPPLTIEPGETVIPEGESRTIKVGGALTGPLSVSDANPAVTKSSAHTVKRAVIVKAKSVGRCSVAVGCEGYETTFVVNVKRYAGKISRTQLAEVTGNPAPAWVMEQAVAQNAPSSIRVEPGASVIYGKPKLPATSLKPGSCTKVMVPIRITGPGLIPVTLLAPVNICNRQLPRKPVAGLFYSNDPEQVKRFGTLFAGQFNPEERTRLLYHHQNMTGHPIQFTIEIINVGDTTASLHAVTGITPPIVDTVIVGYLAGKSFIRDYLGDIGRIFEIPAMSRLVLYTDEVGVKETVSGIMEMQLLSGRNVYLRVRADQPGLMRIASGMIGAASEGSVPRKLSEDVYATPIKRVDAQYAVGGKWTFIRVGKQAITNTSQRLDGNYGVTYNISVNVTNPTGDTKNVKVLFEPTAGPASGIFLIGGKVVGARFVVPPNEFEITSITLAPGESRQLTITTIPLAGSAYPATIIVR